MISLLGVLEYFFPGLGRLLPAYVGSDTEFLAEGGFYRATFSFWGSPAATFVSALALPFVWPLWQLWRGALVRVGLAASVAIQILGIYIGGYRSLWGLVGFVFVVLIVRRKGLIGVIMSAAGAGLAYQLLPQLGQSRFQTLLSALQGNFQDSSALNRWQRLVGAFTVVVHQPWGLGWAGAGWVHSDFLQVAANLGLLAGVLFLAWYLSTLVRLWRLAAQRPDDALTLGLLGGYMVAGGLLVSQGVEVLPQLALPVWFVWALAEARLRHMRSVIGKLNAA